jgi:hypothetical protein
LSIAASRQRQRPLVQEAGQLDDPEQDLGGLARGDVPRLARFADGGEDRGARR